MKTTLHIALENDSDQDDSDKESIESTHADRKPFEAPRLQRHEKLPLVTAGSHDWGFN